MATGAQLSRLVADQALPVGPLGVGLEAFTVYAALAIGDAGGPPAGNILTERR